MAVPMEKQYTYADLLTWDDDVRAELIEGYPVMMAPASNVHQEISMELGRQLANYLLDKRCKVYAAPFGVSLFATVQDNPKDVDTYVEPDLSVVCDLDKLDKNGHGYRGAPPLIIEILSPSNRRHDRFVKYNLYQRAGVREYWIVDPVTQTVLVHSLDEELGTYGSADVYMRGQRVPVGVIEGCEIDLTRVFPS